MNKKKLIMILCMIVTLSFSACNSVPDSVTELIKDNSLVEDDSETIVDDQKVTLKEVEQISVSTEDKEYLKMYYNDGYQVTADVNYGCAKLYIHYKDLVWDTGIEIDFKSSNVWNYTNVSVFGEDAYITFISFDTHLMYKFNLNTYEWQCVLEEDDFEPYVYQSHADAVWFTRVLKTTDKIYILGEAESWINILEYDVNKPTMGLVYKGKLLDENGEPWLGDGSDLFSNDPVLNYGVRYCYEGEDKYTILSTKWVDADGLNESGPMYYTCELLLDEGKVTNFDQTSVPQSEKGADIFVGKQGDELVKYTIYECKKVNEITGEIESSCMLAKLNFKENAYCDLFELPYIYSIQDNQTTKITDKYIIFNANYETYVIDLEQQVLRKTYDDYIADNISGYWGTTMWGKYFTQYGDYPLYLM